MGNSPQTLPNQLKDHKNCKRSSLTRSSHSGVANEGEILETFLLIWLDPDVNTTKENLETQRRLREIITYVITLNDFSSLSTLIEKYSSKQKIILIVSGGYGKNIVPKIHHLPQIIAIFVYCLDVERNKIWSKEYSKIRSVVSSEERLVKKLSANQADLENLEDSKALRIISSEQLVSPIDCQTTSFPWLQLLLEVLISSDYLPSSGTSDELVQILREYSAEDEHGANLVSHFEQTYRADQAVSWLISDTPLARFANKVLREQDMNMLFALRFLLTDIHNQLTRNQIPSVNAFRILPLSKSQLEDIKANPGRLLVVNSFFFASTDISKTMSRVTNNDAFETVLLDIEANDQRDTVPFTLLDKLQEKTSQTMDQNVLFMCGSMFEIGTLIYESSFWRLRLKLVGDQHSAILQRLKDQLKADRNLQLITNLLNQCHQKDKATIFNEKLLSILSQPQSPGRQSIVPTTNIQCLLINLTEHLNEFSSTVLNMLCSLTSNTIFIINDHPIDYSQWKAKSIFIFTTGQCASSLQPIPIEAIVYTFEDNQNDVDQQRRFGSTAQLISQLSDRIIENYRIEAEEYRKSGDINQADEITGKINKIYREVRMTYENSIQKQNPIEMSKPMLFWLRRKRDDDKTDRHNIEETFKNYFHSCRTFYNEHDFHFESVTREQQNNIFAIIHPRYFKTDAEKFEKISNVKYIYRYGPNQGDHPDGNTLLDQNDLTYRLTCDLIDYYNRLANQYRSNKQMKQAREMFLQAKSLCRLLSDIFSTED